METTKKVKLTKYCSYYGCDRLLPEDFSGDTCPHCDHKQYSWDRKEWIKDLPPEAYDVEMKCHKCGSEEELRYREITRYSTFTLGNEYECQSCHDAFLAKMARIEAMNYIVIQPDEDMDFHENKSSVENFFEEYFEDYYVEEENPLEDWVILQVEKIEGNPKKDDFDKRNVIYFEMDWYRVEEVTEPEYEYTGDHSVNW